MTSIAPKDTSSDLVAAAVPGGHGALTLGASWPGRWPLASLRR